MAKGNVGGQKAGAKYIRRELVGVKNGKRVYRYWYFDPKTRKLFSSDGSEASGRPAPLPPLKDKGEPLPMANPIYTVRYPMEQALAVVNLQLAKLGELRNGVIKYKLPPGETRWANVARQMSQILVAAGMHPVTAETIWLTTLATARKTGKSPGSIALPKNAEETEKALIAEAEQLELDFRGKYKAPPEAGDAVFPDQSNDAVSPALTPVKTLEAAIASLGPKDLMSEKGADIKLPAMTAPPTNARAFVRHDNDTKLFLSPVYAKAINDELRRRIRSGDSRAYSITPGRWRNDSTPCVALNTGGMRTMLFDDGLWMVQTNPWRKGDFPASDGGAGTAEPGSANYVRNVERFAEQLGIGDIAATAFKSWGSEAQRAAQLAASLESARRRRKMFDDDDMTGYMNLMRPLPAEGDELAANLAQEATDGEASIGGAVLIEAHEKALVDAVTKLPQTDAEKVGLMTAMNFVPDVVKITQAPAGRPRRSREARGRRALSAREQVRKDVRAVARLELSEGMVSRDFVTSLLGRMATRDNAKFGLQRALNQLGISDDPERDGGKAFIKAIDLQTFAAGVHFGGVKFNAAQAKRELIARFESFPGANNLDNVARDALLTFGVEVARAQHTRIRAMTTFAEYRRLAEGEDFQEKRSRLKQTLSDILNKEPDRISTLNDFKRERKNVQGMFSVESFYGSGVPTRLATDMGRTRYMHWGADLTMEMRAALAYEMESVVKELLQERRSSRSSPARREPQQREPRQPVASPQSPAAQESPASGPPVPLAPVASQMIAQAIAENPQLATQISNINEVLTKGIGRTPKREVQRKAETILDNQRTLSEQEALEQLGLDDSAKMERAWDVLPSSGFADLEPHISKGEHNHSRYVDPSSYGRFTQTFADVSNKVKTAFPNLNLTPTDFLRMAGMPDDASLEYINASDVNNGVRVAVGFRLSDGGSSMRFITLPTSPAGSFEVYNSHFIPQTGGQSGALAEEAGGRAMTMLATQVFMAEKIRKATGRPYKIKTSAAAGTYNGYYTWAQLGYEASQSHSLFDTYSRRNHPLSQKTFRLRDIMSTPMGAMLHRAKDQGFEAVFDTTPGSYSMKRLEYYLRFKIEKRKAREAAQKSVAEWIDIIKAMPNEAEREMALMDEAFMALIEKLRSLMDDEDAMD